MGLTDMGNMRIHTLTHTNQCSEVKLRSESSMGTLSSSSERRKREVREAIEHLNTIY